MKRFSIALFSAPLFVAGLAVGSADAQDVARWKASYIGPPQIHMNRVVLKGWTDRVNADGKGSIEITVVPGLSDFNTAYDNVRNGVAQIGTVQADQVRGKFNKTSVAALPFTARNGTEATLALWKMYEAGLIADEFNEVELIGLAVFPPHGVHSKLPVKSLDDLKGHKVRAGSALAAQVAEAFGGLAVGIPPSEMNQAFDKGVITHVLANYNTVGGFGVMNVARHHLNVELGASVLMLIANKQAWDRAPAAAKEAIRKHGFGNMAKVMGAGTDDPNEEDLAKMKAAGNHTFNDPSSADRARWEKQAAPVIEKWQSDIPNGAAVVAAFKQGVLAARNTR
jgi:TRAP-type transport system periplasmic protein